MWLPLAARDAMAAGCMLVSREAQRSESRRDALPQEPQSSEQRAARRTDGPIHTARGALQLVAV